MKNFKYILLSLLFTGVFSCEIEEISDPNNPSLVDIEADATKSDILLLITGTEELMRSEIGFYYDVLGILGREYYFFTNSDPRYTGELLGKGDAVLDDAGFYGTRPYAGRYKVIRNANILMTAMANTSETLTEAERNGVKGFAKTCQAYSYLLALNLQYQGGIRIDVADTENLGAFVGYDAALGAIAQLLDQAYTDLNGASSEFMFSLSSGFAGFDDPATFGEFNRAIRARVALYAGDEAGALDALGDSFMDLNGDLNAGPKHYYSVVGTEEINPIFRAPDQSEALIAHPSFVTDIRAGDTRMSKVTERTETAVLDGLSGDYDVTVYPSNASPIPIIRNEELILIYAEANIGTDNLEAIDALEVIRDAHGLGAYTGGFTDTDVRNELLYNRRYSLFGEAHRWIDLRRYDMLQTLPKDRAGDDVWTQLPRPVSEKE